MLTEHQSKYFTYLIYNSKVKHNFSFNFITPYSDITVRTNWFTPLSPTKVELYIENTKQETYISDPLVFTDDDRLLINDYTELSNYSIQQELTGDKNLIQYTDIKRGFVKESEIDLLSIFQQELEEDRIKHPNDNLQYLDENKLFVNRYLESEDRWIKTPIKQTLISNSSSTLEFKRVPTGKTVVVLLDNNNCVSSFYAPGPNEGYLVADKLSINMQLTSITDISFSLILAAATQDYLALTNLLSGLVTLDKQKNSIGFYKSYDRLSLNPQSDIISIKDNAVLLWSLSLVISTIQDRPISERISLVGQELDKKLISLISNLQQILVTSYDEVSGFCSKYLNEFKEFQSKDNIESSFWVCTALSKSLSIVYNERVHEVAAKLYLSVDSIKSLESGPLLNDFNHESWSEVREARYIWSLEFIDTTLNNSLLESEESFSESEYLGNLVLKDNTYSQQLKQTILSKSEDTRTFKEEVFASVIDTDFNLINRKVFDLLAKETKGYLSYLEAWERQTWPSGYKWNLNDKAYKTGSVLNSIFSANAYAAFSSSLKLKRLENSLRLSGATGELLNNFSSFFKYRELETDNYWRNFLQQIADATNEYNRLDVTALEIYGLKPSFERQLFREWDIPKKYDWFSSPEQEVYITKEFNPLNPKEEDYYYIAYYPKQRFLDSSNKLGGVPVLKIDYIKRPVPGFSQYLDCSQEVYIDDEYDITADSNYYIDPIHKYVGQVWVDTVTLPECFTKVMNINLIAGVKVNTIYHSLFNVIS